MEPAKYQSVTLNRLCAETGPIHGEEFPVSPLNHNNANRIWFAPLHGNHYKAVEKCLKLFKSVHFLIKPSAGRLWNINLMFSWGRMCWIGSLEYFVVDFRPLLERRIITI